MGKIIDGKGLAEKIRGEIAIEVSTLKEKAGIVPRLVVVLVGDDPASLVYVRNKEKACLEAGIVGEVVRLPENTDEKTVIETVRKINSRSDVDGVLVQLPLPKGINQQRVLSEISSNKDVDGLDPENIGRLIKGENPSFIACTPQGCLELILSTGIEIKGKDAVVVGRSNIVGKPMAFLLLEKHATVTVCHSRTKNIGEVTKRADILVAAVGRSKMIKADMVKPGAVVIDVGMNRDENKKLCGDVDFQAVRDVASFITPVPGGVGPMTIAMLLRNTLLSAKRRAKII
ncbi:MAG: bifunctional methylenetetrahydrofolate dehydrogenase/methenyltetrahydrofolate cyclohydrolase FolD [bacterium]